MISPQEAESRVFSKASFGGGYNMAQVDAFLDELLSDYAALYKENAALKSKMKVLAEKLEEYRATEDAMRRTLLTAQQMADSMVKEAELQKAEAIGKAENEAKTRIDEIRRDLNNEELRLTAARNSTARYVEKLKALYDHELDYIGNLAELTPESGAAIPDPDPAPELEHATAAFAAAPRTTTATELEQTRPVPPLGPSLSVVPPDSPTAAEAVMSVDPSADTVVFDRLQFGRDYQFE